VEDFKEMIFQGSFDEFVDSDFSPSGKMEESDLND
jgi:hypothetical protein